ncbi:type II secretion system F family protein [Arthrobacter sp. ISL-95]|uniref:type II secretion system F family protein n=1 Tax=Arthrobacter sp. ISL-95 TaxID=2819116 RepID=UPI001BEBD817|nr:type II secretion system F family protein [Arthrobacter sp. ISL-95]MBT2585467.1 type II secretion system F family protein [Arthrobacter sp. ISL-95]
MYDAPVLAMIAVIALASFLSFAAPTRMRTQLLPRGREIEAAKESSASTHADTGSDGLRDTAMMLELVASMLDAGAGIGRALELIGQCASPPIRRSLRPVVAALAIGADWETAWRTPTKHAPEVVRLKDALAFAALTGAPSASILYAQAARERREQFRAAEKRAAALGVKLVVPLGLCSLPAFICLGIVPVLIAMLPSG